ncbi:hypothetical protein WOLCODRAFT_26941 [Wolfiporia cocos MD-104 SS10]|uniref:Secreted protein n=1 Tax=Wolfiporia cocos (strain MD-104) TaxID=742152 RepID=A0A2H3JR83_WOLCO|nr:hypothetical protein WOLCODRAFT_26941 [Wolfiporia cocos MD-104 SS10]
MSTTSAAAAASAWALTHLVLSMRPCLESKPHATVLLSGRLQVRYHHHHLCLLPGVRTPLEAEDESFHVCLEKPWESRLAFFHHFCPASSRIRHKDAHHGPLF